MMVVYYIVSNCFRKKDQTSFSRLLIGHVLQPSSLVAKSLDNTENNFKICNLTAHKRETRGCEESLL